MASNPAEARQLLRLVNEQIQAIRGPDWPDDMEFVCECGATGCDRTILTEWTAFEDVRSRPGCFMVTPIHAPARADLVIEVHDQYVILCEPTESGEGA